MKTVYSKYQNYKDQEDQEEQEDQEDQEEQEEQEDQEEQEEQEDQEEQEAVRAMYNFAQTLSSGYGELNAVALSGANSQEDQEEPFSEYLVMVLNNNVMKREGPGKNYKVTGPTLKHDIFKILEESKDENQNIWGKISSGWIPIRECKKI